jgi:hypothetical protein
MVRLQRPFSALTLALFAMACTPTLNWREVPIGPVTAILPCKPDRGTRTVRLMDQDWQMHMAGCEAGGALYAISYLQLNDTATSFAVTDAWRQSALSRMQATPSPDAALAPGNGANAAIVQARGRQADGSAVQAQLRWFLVGTQLFHAAVYAPRLSVEMTDPFFSDLPQR